MDLAATDFVFAGTLDELKAEGRRLVRGAHPPILVVYDRGQVFALDNRCPHMGFPLHKGTVDDGILTCHWHHARFDVASGCTFDLWADDVPTCRVDVRNGEVWVNPVFGFLDPPAHWRRHLADGMAHNLGLVIAKSVLGLLAARVAPIEIVRQAAVFGGRNRDGWSTGLTILTALGNLLSLLPEEESYLALFHGVRRVATDCDGEPPRRERTPLASAPDLAALKRWFRRWTTVRHREGAERTLLTAIAARSSPAALADLLFAAETDRAFADGGHSLDFINKAFECLDLIGWEHAPALLPTVVGQMAAARGAEESTAWRQPVDLVDLLNDAFDELPALFAAGAHHEAWGDHAALSHVVLADDPKAVIEALKEAFAPGLRRPTWDGRSPTQRRSEWPALVPRTSTPTGKRRTTPSLTATRCTRRSNGWGTNVSVKADTVRPCAVCSTAPWQSISPAISTFRPRGCPGRRANRSTTCPPAPTRSRTRCLRRSIASNRWIPLRGSSPVICFSATPPRR